MPNEAPHRAYSSRAAAWVLKRWRDDAGNIAITTALLAPMLVSMTGFAIDFGYASYIKQKMDRAAEAAVIGAVSQSAASAMGGYSNTNGLHLYGNALFKANISQFVLANVTQNVDVVLTASGGATATSTYSVGVPTYFSSLIGIRSIPLNGSAQAKANPITYINYYIVVDTSQSMGIAATQTAMADLYQRVVNNSNGSGGAVGCVFGCHVKQSGQKFTNEYLAHNVSPTIPLRIDSAVAAIQSIISDAANSAGANKSLKIGLYTMSGYPTNGTKLTTVASPSSNFTALSTAAATIDLGDNNAGGTGDSDFSTSLGTFNQTLPVNGVGTSTSPLNYVFIVTDGLTDTSPAGNKCYNGHCTSAFAPSFCSDIKLKATVGVIYTTFLPIYNENNSAKGFENGYSHLAAPYVDQIAPNLQSCATSNKYYFEATDGPAINTAMKALFASTQQTATLQK